MLDEPIRTLIRTEHARQTPGFLDGVDIDRYLAKLDQHAEIVSDVAGERCRGVVAFYCNDIATKQAFITLVLVDPRDRGLGIGRALVTEALSVARRRGCTTCRLEVTAQNAAALGTYRSVGFASAEDRGDRLLMEVTL